MAEIWRGRESSMVFANDKERVASITTREWAKVNV
jgi:hypothetical protein